ncbi:IS630 family transposase [Streptomyces asiaticus]|uniref:IS630 family transposase n=1 Tax=Streptomyces asiaticus TaxID=114695 RepID=UPI003F67EF9A
MTPSAAGASVPRRGPKLEPLLLSDEERAVLQRWSRRATSAQALALRARIVLACAGPEVPPIVVVARELRVAADTVRKWRRRFLAERLDGLADEPRPGRPPAIGVDRVEAVVVTTLEEIPKNATHWSRKSMAEHSGLSKSTVGRIWRKFQLKPHLTDTFKLSTDSLFVEKVYDVVGLYFNPPDGAMVLSVDEKSQIQVLERSQPVLLIMPGMPERRTHDYVRNGLTTLFAAFDVATGEVISSLHRRHRAAEFKKFLIKIDKEVPAHLQIHLICDNYGTHKTAGADKSSAQFRRRAGIGGAAEEADGISLEAEPDVGVDGGGDAGVGVAEEVLGDDAFDAVLAEYFIRAGHAACLYSWRMPPRRSWRRMSRLLNLSGSSIGEGSGCSGRAFAMECRLRESAD